MQSSLWELLRLQALRKFRPCCSLPLCLVGSNRLRAHSSTKSINSLILLKILRKKQLNKFNILLSTAHTRTVKQLWLTFSHAMVVAKPSSSVLQRKRLTRSNYVKKSRKMLRSFMERLARESVKLPSKSLNNKSVRYLWQLMSPQEVQIFQELTWLSRLNHLRTQRLTFTDQEELLEPVAQVNASPSIR